MTPDLDDLTPDKPRIGHGDGPGPIPFDPRRTPPGRVVSDVKEWIANNLLWVILGLAALGYAWSRVDPDLSLPLWARVMVVATPVCAAIAWAPMKRAIKWLHTDDVELAAEVDPANGDLRVVGVEPQWWANARFVDHDGNEIDRSALHRIATSEGMAYEVDRIDVERDVVVASWFADAGNVEVRRHKSMVRDIQRRLSVIADQVLDLRANVEPTVRDAARETSMHLIEQAEGIRSPDGEPISDAIGVEVSDGVGTLDDRLGSIEDAIERADEQAADDGAADGSDGVSEGEAVADGGETR